MDAGKKCGNCKHWERISGISGNCICRNTGFLMSIEYPPCKYHEYKQENKPELNEYENFILIELELFNKANIEEKICKNCVNWSPKKEDELCRNLRGECADARKNNSRRFSKWDFSCNDFNVKQQENKMKIEQYIPEEQIEPVKKYPKWSANIDIDGAIYIIFVSGIGEPVCCAVEGCKEILNNAGYETDFAEWGEDGEFIRFKEGWY